MEKSLGEIGLP